jgi:TatD DNase family protein
MLFDSHCHLTSEPLAPQLSGVLQRAREAGVTRVLNIGDSIETSRAALAQIPIAQEYDVEMKASAGVHPQNATEFCFDSTPGVLRALAADKSVVAIGEIGLDFVYDENHPRFPGAPRDLQAGVLRAQLQLALELNLPVVIHNREADEALLQIVAEYSRPEGALRGVFHCFGSSLDTARRVLDFGFYLGFTGIVTFKNAPAIREVAAFCPPEKLLIETDAPYLAPTPQRGKTNEPSFLPHIAEAIAQTRNVSVAEIAAQTSRNARQLFDVSLSHKSAEK